VTHCTDDDLVLHHYGDPEVSGHVAAHLAVCGGCRERAEDLAASLQLVTIPDAPDPGGSYGAELWQRLAPRLESSPPFWRSWLNAVADQPLFRVTRVQASWLAAAAALLLMVGFVAGRVTPGPAALAPRVAIDAEQARRVLLMSVADHLERTDRVLTDIMNASVDGDISAERQWAADLITDNRFYRQDAVDSEEQSVAAVLDELERALLDIVHSPSEVTPATLEAIHRRLDSAALLFKVRVLGNELRHRQQDLPPPSSTPIASRTS
jgi:hypothetical protein